MKKNKSNICSALLLGMLAQTAIAQDYSSIDYKPYPHVFITLQGGGQLTFTDYKSSKLITPVGAFSVGGMFAPAIGVRLNVNGWKTKGGLKSLNKTYDYNYVNSNLDLMVNLTNIIMPKDRIYPLNVYLIGGVGLTYAWDNDDLKGMIPQAPDRNLNYAWDDDRLVHNFRAGMQLEANLVKNVSVNLEVTANNLADRFNSKINGRGDWQLQALAGVTFKFGYRKKPAPILKRHEEPVVPVEEPVVPVEEPVVPVEQPTPAPVVKPVAKKEMKEVHVFFGLNSAVVTSEERAKLQELVDWMRKNPEAKTELQGYADAKTGTRSYNKTISKERTEEVTNILIKEYGISKDRISTKVMGDSVQPFGENDKNRVVIAISK